jgi:aryl-alcohol dehydrogenase-like predicted oxidoreductase
LKPPKDPILGIGTAAFLPGYGLGRNCVSGVDLCVTIEEAIDRGISYIDTASGYGASEQVLGQLAEKIASRKVRICTKLMTQELGDGPKGSLARMQAAKLDTLLLHSAGSEDLTRPEVSGAMTEIKKRDLVMKTGASTYGPGNAALAIAQPWCDVLQVEHSLLNPSVVRSVRGRKRSTQEMVVRSVLCKGLLTSRRYAARHLDQAANDLLDRIEERAKLWRYSLEELAIRYALDTPGVDVVLVGVSTVDELRVALSAAMRPRLEAWQLEALEEFESSKEVWTHPEQWPVAV